MSGRLGVWPAVLFALLGVLGISAVQPGLAHNIHKLHQRDDVFLLPPPGELRVMTLGYRAAATDMLWAKLLLEYGVHGQEKRAFPDVTRYIDGILALEPDFPALYDYVDTILVYIPPPGGTAEDARTARRYLERGMQERPYDGKFWVHAGQFIAFIGPAFIKEEKESEQWRVDGAKIIAHGVELGGDTYRSLAASTILGHAGEREAQIQHLQRAFAVSDNPDDRAQFLRKLRALQVDADSELAITAVDRELAPYRFVSRGTGLLIGPRRSAALCAGPGSYERRGCARDWASLVRDAR
ncbi:MAG: hypothetical protein NVS3B10_09110 [Polyangiales bacterium]